MTTDQETSGEIVATWLDHGLASELKAQAERERRSVSSLVRNVLEDFADGDGGDRRERSFAPSATAPDFRDESR